MGLFKRRLRELIGGDGFPLRFFPDVTRRVILQCGVVASRSILTVFDDGSLGAGVYPADQAMRMIFEQLRRLCKVEDSLMGIKPAPVRKRSGRAILRRMRDLTVCVAMGLPLGAQGAEVKQLAEDQALLATVQAGGLGFKGVSDDDFIAALTRALNFDEGSALSLEKRALFPNGKSVLKFEQTHDGLPLWGRRVIVTRAKDGTVEALSGTAVTGFATGYAAIKKLPEEEALSRAKSAATALVDGRALEQVTGVKSREVIYLDSTGVAVRAYEVSFAARATGETSSLVRPIVIVDAGTGEIRKMWDGLAQGSAGTASGPGGNRKTGLYIYGRKGRPPLKVATEGQSCTLRTPEVLTGEANPTTSGFEAPYTFGCTQSASKEVNGSFSPINDAHAFGQITVEMYREWFGISPFDSAVKIAVDYPAENAFWTGREVLLGRGGETFHALTTLDIVSHEIGHALTERNSGLIYEGQSGAINESFSDMAAVAAEAYAGPRYGFEGSQSFLIGQSATKKARAVLRNMCDPSQDGRSIARASDYRNGMDVHLASGVFNKAFCLLSKTEAWSVRQAFELFLVANQIYWQPASDFKTAARDVALAAQLLGYDKGAVDQAFLSVGIDSGGAVAATEGAEPAHAAPAICSFLGDRALSAVTLSAAQKADAVAIVGKIVEASGLAKNFEIGVAPVPNAAAVIVGGSRRVLYNPDFLDRLAGMAASKWAPISVLAHEIGHHLNGHTIGSGGSRPALELEADKFSGFILQRLGASLKDATVTIETLAPQADTRTHPGRAQRLEAIAEGWVSSCRKDPDCRVPETSEWSEGRGPAEQSSSSESDAPKTRATIHNY